MTTKRSNPLPSPGELLNLVLVGAVIAVASVLIARLLGIAEATTQKAVFVTLMLLSCRSGLTGRWQLLNSASNGTQEGGR